MFNAIFMLKFNCFATLIIFFALFGCRSHYALLNEGNSQFRPKAIQKNLTYNVEKLSKKEVFVKHGSIEPQITIKAVPIYFPEISVENPSVVIPAFPSKKIVQKPDPKAKAKKKKQRQRRNFWRRIGSKLFIGVVFLAIAVLMSIIHLQTLALLFGFASILFLIFGLKKVFRRRMRNPFEKNR